MKIVKQFSVSMVNRPGVLANISRALADGKVNIIALTISDSSDLGVLRIIVDKQEEAKTILSRMDSPVTESEVLLVEMPNRPGALASVAEKLNRAHISINYAYTSIMVQGGQATAVLKLQYPEKAIKILQESESKRESKFLVRPNFRR